MRLIGMVIPDGTNPFFSNLALQAQRQLSIMGYPLVVLNTDNSLDNELDSIRVLCNMGVSGILFVSAGDNDKAYRELFELKIPVTIIDREIPEVENCDFVITDNRAGVILAVEHLHGWKHRNIGILKGQQNTDPGRVRYAAYLESLEKFGLPNNPRHEFDGEFDYWSGEKAADQIYQLPMVDRPTALICCNDIMAFGLLQQLIRNGINVPDDISIVGIDDIPLSSWVEPRITTVRQEIMQIAQEAAELLVSRMTGFSGGARSRYIKPRLMIRNSVKMM